MEEFLKTYVSLCKDGGLEPEESVVAHLLESRDAEGFTLNLGGLGLSVESCRVLGQALQRDQAFTEVSLKDCMLSEEGARLLLTGLFDNTSVKVLDLKGNNLRVKGAEVLGKLLTRNKTLCRLVLEWNSLGVWDEAFSLFCKGLASNSALTHLDLRNNQISHHGAAALALALKCNDSMQVLDLRWNNVGLLGGRSLLEALQKNTSLVQLEMAGNNIPSDTLRGLEQARCHNSDKKSILSENRRRVHLLTEEIHATKLEKSQQSLDLMKTIDRQREEIGRSCRSTSIQIGQLQEALNERKCSLNSLTAKLQMTEAALALSDERNHKVGGLLAQLQMETEEQREQQIRQRKKEQEENVLREGKLLKEIQHLTEINIQLRNKVKEMEHECRCQKQQILALKQESINNSAELKLRLAQTEDRLEAEKQRFTQALEDADTLRQKEVERANRRFDESDKALQERIFKLEAQKTQLEEEVSKAKAAGTMERVRAEEQLGRARAEVRLEEQAHVSSLEDKLRSALASQQELHLHSCQQTHTISELQVKASQLTLESDGLRCRMENLKQELAGKDQERMSEVSRVKAELQDQIGHLHAERTAQEALRQRVNALEREIKVLNSNHKEVLLDKESEMTSVLEKLRLREREIQRMREDEALRASHLQSAILTYCQGSSLGQYLSPNK